MANTPDYADDARKSADKAQTEADAAQKAAVAAQTAADAAKVSADEAKDVRDSLIFKQQYGKDLKFVPFMTIGGLNHNNVRRLGALHFEGILSRLADFASVRWM